MSTVKTPTTRSSKTKKAPRHSTRGQVGSDAGDLADRNRDFDDDGPELHVEVGARKATAFRGTGKEDQVQCPRYISWSKMPYQYYYYFLVTNTGVDLKVHDSETEGNKALADFEFATEHIFELQQIASLLEYAGKELETDATKRGAYYESMALEFQEEREKLPVPNETALNHLYSALPYHDADFVYLEARVNGVKGVYFAGKKPAALELTTKESAETIYQKVMDTFFVYMYLKDAHVAELYRDLNTRVRATWQRIGDLFEEEKIDIYRDNWMQVYDDWEANFLEDLAKRMNNAVMTGIKLLEKKKEADMVASIKQQQQALGAIGFGHLTRTLGQEAELEVEDRKQREILEKIWGQTDDIRAELMEEEEEEEEE